MLRIINDAHNTDKIRGGDSTPHLFCLSADIFWYSEKIKVTFVKSDPLCIYASQNTHTNTPHILSRYKEVCYYTIIKNEIQVISWQNWMKCILGSRFTYGGIYREKGQKGHDKREFQGCGVKVNGNEDRGGTCAYEFWHEERRRILYHSRKLWMLLFGNQGKIRLLEFLIASFCWFSNCRITANSYISFLKIILLTDFWTVWQQHLPSVYD